MGNNFINLRSNEEKSLIIENPNQYYHPKEDSMKLVKKDQEIRKLQRDLAELKKSRKIELSGYRNEFEKSERQALMMLGPQKRSKEICIVAKNHIIDCLQSNPKETLNCQNTMKEYVKCVHDNKLL